MGSAQVVICSGTTAMIGLAAELCANSFMFGMPTAIPQPCTIDMRVIDTVRHCFRRQIFPPENGNALLFLPCVLCLPVDPSIP